MRIINSIMLFVLLGSLLTPSPELGASQKDRRASSATTKQATKANRAGFVILRRSLPSGVNTSAILSQAANSDKDDWQSLVRKYVSSHSDPNISAAQIHEPGPRNLFITTCSAECATRLQKELRDALPAKLGTIHIERDSDRLGLYRWPFDSDYPTETKPPDSIGNGKKSKNNQNKR